MASLKPSTYILGIIFFIGIILGGMGLMAEFRASDPTFMADSQTTAFNASFNKYADLGGSVNSLKNATSVSTNWGILGVVGSLIGTVWNSLVLLYTSLGFMNAAFAGLALFGIPGWVSALMGMVIIVIIAFAIISAISAVDQ